MYVHLYSLHGSNRAASELEFASLPLSREENGMRIGMRESHAPPNRREGGVKVASRGNRALSRIGGMKVAMRGSHAFSSRGEVR